MTSVRNHQQRLNGSKILAWVALCILIVFSTSCKGLKKGAKGNTTTGVETVEWEKDNSLAPLSDDIVKTPTKPTTTTTKPKGTTNTSGTVVSNSGSTSTSTNTSTTTTTTTTVGNQGTTTYPSTSVPSTSIPSSNPNAYNVAIMAPFYTNKAGSTINSKSSIKSLQFYAGAKLALEKLGNEGFSANIYTYDTQGSSGQTQATLQQGEFYNMDLIIGPLKTSPLKATAESVKSKQTVLVSPWNPKTSITKNNPKYVQVSPSLKTHARAIMRHARNHFNAEDIVLTCKDGTKEHKYFKYFQDENKVISGDPYAPQLAELRAEYGNDIPLDNYFRPGTTVFIIPSWDEAFVSNLLRKISLHRGNRKIVIYGMPQWKKFQRVDYDYYERLNVHISDAIFVDKDNMEVKDFRTAFFNKMGTVPTDDAFLGYDVTLYFGRQLMRNGRSFITTLGSYPSQQGEYFTNRFDFQSVSPSGTDDFSNISRFENRHVNILKFENSKFQIAY